MNQIKEGILGIMIESIPDRKDQKEGK